MIGDPTGATREQGEEILDTLSDSWVQAHHRAATRCVGRARRADLGPRPPAAAHPVDAGTALAALQARSLHHPHRSSHPFHPREVPPCTILRSSAPLLAAAAALAFAAARRQAQEKFTYMTNWYAQAEHGGFYQAVATGIYKKYGLDVTIKMGGPQVNIMQMMAAGQTDCIMGSSDMQMMQARAGGLPVVTVAAIFQKDPQVLIAHEDVKSFEDLKGKTILIAPSGPPRLLAVAEGQVRLHRRADAALHLQHPALRRRQEHGAAGLPDLRALRDPEGRREGQRLPVRRPRLARPTRPPSRAWTRR